MGDGCPERGSASLAELAEVGGALGLPVERDPWFTPARTLGIYSDAAPAAGDIHA